MSDEERNSFRNWKDGTKQFPITDQKRFLKAIDCFSKAIKKDAGNARAHGWLAYTYVTGVIDKWEFPKGSGITNASGALAEAGKLADTALKLDPDDYDNHWAKGFVSLHTKDYTDASDRFGEARFLNHGNRELLVESADERVYAGEYDKAIELVDRAFNLPDWYHWVYAWAHYFKARESGDSNYLDQAIDHLDANVSGTPGQENTPAEIHLLRAAIHGQRHLAGMAGEEGKAVDEREKYEKARGHTLSLQHIENTNPFKVQADLDYWLAGLKAAGFK